ncbi:peptidase M48 [Acidovorax sp. Leaf76]|uniref:M48 family metallopeptidase n=1 Tax=unclassified Acidovorax TaxID=2684926 RepID=UPI000700754E|nr:MULTISPECIES: M48 family metallopeptidase [unclassified Acidovorax]KQO22208.1 peptidase M48 [Acidovorax sp. Leaf76]KQO35277.1 peptidase M48 [Acidovorax sp. Leaf84]KQS35060.1 peptidase M48 [Acidovorax sp. Leaf191]
MPITDDLSPSLLLTLAFAAALSLGLVIKLWLASRQIRHVARHRDAVPAPFAERIPLAAHQKAADYTVTKARLGLLEMSLGAAVLLGWTLLGGLDALNQALLGLMGGGMGQQLALLVAFAAIGGLIDLPLSLYQTFVVEERFGFNKMTWRLWLGDAVKGLLVGAVIGLPIAAMILWLMGAAGPLWWLWAWCFWMGFNLLLMVVYPTFIAPLFNKFQPLEDESLKARVTALMQRCGFSAKGLFVMDGSRRSAHANAYFTGFGAAKRVVFYDTLLRQLAPGEVEAVLAHELGHFKHRHIIQRIVTMFALSLAGFALLGWLSTQVWFYTGLGVRPNISLDPAMAAAPNDALALLLFLLVVPVFTFFISPLFSQQSRRHEFQADAYAVAQSSGADLSSALLKLYEDNASTLTPDPVYVKFYYSHPPATERLARMQPTAQP